MGYTVVFSYFRWPARARLAGNTNLGYAQFKQDRAHGTDYKARNQAYYVRRHGYTGKWLHKDIEGIPMVSAGYCCNKALDKFSWVTDRETFHKYQLSKYTILQR